MLEITKVLKKNGYKVTPQRLAVFNVLKHNKKHPCVDSIYNELQPKFPTMSLATVYKSLEVFKTLGLVQELNIGEGSFRYDANTKPHPHVICLKCGKVDDIEYIDSLNLTDYAETKTGYKITGQQIYFYGYCPECKN
ncbi:MAG: transcriptional repressor [Firmicutes bacterium]|nr:transcriptional repressor [Bacillota bacterium]